MSTVTAADELVEGRVLAGIVAEAWEMMLGSALRDVPAGEVVGATDVACMITITGEVSGTVVLQATEETLLSCAENMLGMTPDELSREDTLDAFGELTNIVGGGVKSRLPEPSALGLPAVVEGHEVRLSVPGGRLAAAVLLLSDTGPVRASFWMQKA